MGNTMPKEEPGRLIAAILILLSRPSLRERLALAFFLVKTVSSTNRFCDTQPLNFRFRPHREAEKA
jgi:hypothetical protein